MRSARNQLILLGFICQGLTWDSYALVMFNVILWLLCLLLPRRPIRLGPEWECVALVGGSVAGYALSRLAHQSPHFFIGHGLTFLQAVRLLRPLDRREKVFSMLAACVHLGVACTVILDYRFLPVVMAAVILLPRTFMELEFESYPEPLARAKRPSLKAVYAAVAFIMITLFVAVPRGWILAAIPPLRTGSGSDSSLLDSILDPARSASALSGKTVLQVQGEHLGPLRCYALADFDGRVWTRDRRNPWHRVSALDPDQAKDYNYRRVRVKDVGLLGRVLPTDGAVVQVRGRFFRRPFRNHHGMIECDQMWSTANNLYEYWTDLDPPAERLYRLQREQCRRYPPQSARLRAWLDQRLAGVTDPQAQAHRLEIYFRENFTYKLGAPELNRLSPVDDFVFNQKEGHCERYASTLALLLRMQGIPSRVVIGYLPSTQSWLSGWYNVRARDAHAWTEAYFEDKGWIELDATPRATTPQPNYFVSDLVDALDVVWYLNIVNFDSASQRDMLRRAVIIMSESLDWVRRHWLWLAAAALLVLLPAGWYQAWSQHGARKREAKGRRATQVQAQHYYGRMLRLLARKGIHRPPQQTPLEFLRDLRTHYPNCATEAAFVTDLFCANRYGNSPLSDTQRRGIEAALGRIKQGATRSDA